MPLLPEYFPVLGVCGYSGSGKTTLIRQLIVQLTLRGLRVAVIKHDAHGLDVDRKGKDSDVFFRAGATVMAAGPGEVLQRQHATESDDLEVMIHRLALDHDLVLVEGFKMAPLRWKIWLRRTAKDAPPDEVGKVALDLKSRRERESAALHVVENVLKDSMRQTPLYAGILMGGRSERMGRPKHLIRSGSRTWLERTVSVVRPLVGDVILMGSGKVPGALKSLNVIPDMKDHEGPVAGMLAAMRWAPWAAWVFLACDMPWISRAALKWLLAQRDPGVWAILPQSAGGIEPLLAWYDFRARSLLESVSGPCQIARLPKVITPSPPRGLAGAWLNCNTPEDLASVRATR